MSDPLTPPEPSLISGVSFSPGGTHLAVITETSRVFLWDLRSVRQRLRDMNLDWDHPPLAAAPREVVPVRVRIDKEVP